MRPSPQPLSRSFAFNPGGASAMLTPILLLWGTACYLCLRVSFWLCRPLSRCERVIFFCAFLFFLVCLDASFSRTGCFFDLFGLFFLIHFNFFFDPVPHSRGIKYVDGCERALKSANFTRGNLTSVSDTRHAPNCRRLRTQFEICN